MTGPIMLRRALLVLVTTLLVARPLVLGEDPGLTDNLSDPWGMVLTLLWLVAALGWAVWRFWLRPTGDRGSWIVDRESKIDDSSRSTIHDPRSTSWYGGLVQTALLATVAIVFVSAEYAARYKFPARLIAWEWFGLFVTFFVMRQLAVTPTEQRGLFAVVLAGAVALSAQGIYQQFVELPSNRRLAEDPEKLRAAWAAESGTQETSEGFLEQLRRRALEKNIYGPYANPNSYASYLVLWLPGLIGAVVVCRRTQAPNWQTILAACFAVLGGAALWLTHSRGALLGLVLAGVGVAVLIWRQRLRAHWIAALAGALLLVGLGYAASWSGLLTTGMGKTSTTAAARLDYWPTTWRMIAERPWLGVGPGNFQENYTRLMSPTAQEKIKDPHNFALEMWATCGIFALLALLVGIAAFFYRVVKGLGRAGSVSDRREAPVAYAPGSPTPAVDAPRSEPVRWEFYVGGMFGLLLGFVLRANGLSPQAILSETWVALLRAVVWFAAFGLLERIAWSDRGRVLALMMGIAAVLLNLCVSSGIDYPSVAGPLWVAVALALNAVSLRPVAWLSRPGAAMILPLPILVGVVLGYAVYFLYPVLAAASLTHEADESIAYFQTELAKPAKERAEVIGNRTRRINFIRKAVLERLEKAERLTPDDARLHVQLAWWHGLLWQHIEWQTARSDLEIAKQAILYGDQATRLDPEGGQGYWVQYVLRTRLFAVLNEEVAAKGPNRDPLFVAARERDARRQYELAALKLEEYLPYDPTDAALRYQLARAWFKAGDKEKGREQAEAAARLDAAAVLPTRRLADPYHKQVEDWLSSSPSG